MPPFLPWVKKDLPPEHYALKDINLELKKGASLGILGQNGAGKSTLLKLLAGVTPPDRGTIHIQGRVFSMIELNAGMSMELTGRENISLLGTIMGFSSSKIRKLLPGVIEFSELGDWIDRPVWQYSSGMQSRLAFGLAVHAEADILLVDEILAVGDIKFQKKSFKKMQELLGSGITVILVTHSPYQVERLCSQAIIMEHGRITSAGESLPIVQEYLRKTGFSSAATSGERQLIHSGTGDILFTNCHFENPEGRRLDTLESGEDVNLVLEYEASEDIEAAEILCRITDEYQRIVATIAPSREEYKKSLIRKGKGTVVCHLPNFPLLGSRFGVSIKCSNGVLLDAVEDILEFTSVAGPNVQKQGSVAGITYVPSNWRYPD